MANSVHLLNKDDNLRLEISGDNSAAYLIIKDASEVVDANNIVELLNQAGIVAGFEEAAHCNKKDQEVKEFNTPFLIAKGSIADLAPIAYQINTESGFNPENLHWETLKNTTIVSADAPLAKINFNTSGSNIDIFGKELSEQSNKINPYDLMGTNVYYNDKDLTIYSTQKGYAYLDKDNKLHVTNQLKITESLQNSSISSYGDLIIEGDIVDSYLEHDGNLKVLGNIVNCRNGGVTVNGEISLETGDNSNIYADQAIIFHKDMRYCTCLTNGYISGAEDGAFVGGSASAGNYIDVDKIGSPFQITTSMEIAIAPFQKLKISKRMAKLEKISPDSVEYSLQSTQLALEENEFFQLMETSITNSLSVYINASKVIYKKTSIRVLNRDTTLSKDHDAHRFAKNDPKLS